MRVDKFDDSRAIFRSKFLAYSIIVGNIISNPTGEYCFSSMDEARFASTKCRPETRESRVNIQLYILKILKKKKIIMYTLIYLFFTNIPLLHRKDTC